MTALSAKIVFPAPPPTTNTLTPQQRTQLIRSTNKLGRILGTTPHLIDMSSPSAPMHIHLPLKGTDRFSTDSERISYGSAEPLFRTTSRSSSKSSLSAASLQSKKDPSHPSDSWPSRRPPMLRLAVGSPSLDAIPASPLTPLPKFTQGPYKPASEDEQSFTIRPPTVPSSQSPQVSPIAPSFTIPSISTERRRKMERLRRKLGEDVPLDLVFPSSDSSEDSDEDISQFSPVSSVSSSAATSPSSSPVRSKPKSFRIQNARDSLALFSPHRAPRASAPTRSFQDTYSPTYVISESRPSSSRGKDDKLGVIMESPNEHSSGCAQEFGILPSPKASSEGCESFDSAWYGSEDEFNFQVQMWSTRRGYGGW